MVPDVINAHCEDSDIWEVLPLVKITTLEIALVGMMLVDGLSWEVVLVLAAFLEPARGRGLSPHVAEVMVEISLVPLEAQSVASDKEPSEEVELLGTAESVASAAAAAIAAAVAAAQAASAAAGKS